MAYVRFSSARNLWVLLALATCLSLHSSAQDTSAQADSRPHTPPVLLQMIRDDAIHEELQLTPVQRDQVHEALPAVDGPWFRSRQLTADQQQIELDKLTRQLTDQLATILSDQQRTRLQQLQRQAIGTRMLVQDDVVDLLQLTEQQRAALVAAFVKTDQESASIQKQLQSGKIESQTASDKTEKLQAEEKRAVAAQLTNAQKKQLPSITGKPFDFRRVQRIYPRAPELTSEGVQWIQAGPIRLADLRGKVVAVHFYAFQCINCVRNLPHYKSWHDDFADKDLVVIGIQTPELPAERDAGRVANAAKSAGIEYPVLLDAQSSNWKAWSNTMWPTVYLIDKQGYLRRWWQGELNWKGAEGEKELRQTIQQLLKE